MDDLLYRYTANENKTAQIEFDPELEPIIKSVHESMEAMTAEGFDTFGFHIDHWNSAPGRVVYYISHGGEYLCFTSVCLHEVGSEGAWDATERNFLELTELAPDLDLGWQPGTVAPPAPWFATALYPSFLTKHEAVARLFGSVEQCIVWSLLRDFRKRFPDEQSSS